MKRMIARYSDRPLSSGILKTVVALLLGVAFASAFWIASTPIANGQAKLTPAEMIQSQLPAGKTIGTATDKEVLEAVCKAMKKWPKEAASIVRATAGARKNLRGDILCMAIRCLRDNHALDCGWVVEIVREWIKAQPDWANQLTNLVVDCSPECRDMLQAVGEGAFANPPSNINPPPGSTGGGAAGNPCIVCQNGREIQVSCEDVSTYVASHPGAITGPCGVTPSTNR